LKKFTLVSTVFNEISRLNATIEDIEKQTLKPNEIIVTDAGSTDGTFEKLQNWVITSDIQIIVLQQKGCNVAQGRNLAIKNASNDLIVSTDFGCRFHPDWLKSIVMPFDDKEVKVVGGAYSVIEEEITTKAAKANFLLTNGYKTILNDYFIPSSRSIAYYKFVWEEAKGYPEWLTFAADDLVFGKVIKALGFKTTFVNQPYVYWGRHSSGMAYAKESFRYGLGDGEARVNGRNTISNLLELMLRYLLFVTLLLFAVNCVNAFMSSVFFLAATPSFLGLRSYYYAFKNWVSLRSKKYHIGVFLFSLLVIEITRFNYIKGYFKGYFFSTIDQRREAESLKQILE